MIIEASVVINSCDFSHFSNNKDKMRFKDGSLSLFNTSSTALLLRQLLYHSYQPACFCALHVALGQLSAEGQVRLSENVN